MCFPVFYLQTGPGPQIFPGQPWYNGSIMKEKNIPFKPKENIELTITGLGSSGEGVGKINSFTFFVPGALPGERVQAQVTVLKKNYGQARLSKLLVPSPDRVKPPCPVYAQCGGCQLQHLSYPAQLALKRQTVIDALERIGHFRNLAVLDTLGAQDPWHYRNKMQVPAAQGKNHTLHIGCYAQGTHRVIDASSSRPTTRSSMWCAAGWNSIRSRPWRRMPGRASYATSWDGWACAPARSWPYW